MIHPVRAIQAARYARDFDVAWRFAYDCLEIADDLYDGRLSRDEADRLSEAVYKSHDVYVNVRKDLERGKR